LHAPQYKGRTYLAYLTSRSYISPSAIINHKDFQIDEKVFIGDRVVIYQAKDGGYVNIGKMSHIHQDCIIETGGGGKLLVGADTHVQPRCQFSAYKGSIVIGSYVQIAPNCSFYPYDHEFFPGELIKKQPLKTRGDIIIGDDVWLGVGVIVLNDVRIGAGAVIGAGSVVTHNVPDGAIAVGNPAQVKKYRKDLSHWKEH
jgi:acetyltransferase-like isoleucine patch superfamily enzyme